MGATVRAREHHRIEERRGMVGRIACRYGGDGYVAVDGVVQEVGGRRLSAVLEDRGGDVEGG